MRVAEIGKGVHGKVWLCEDTETGEYYAIKCVNRESRRQLKNLRRSQAEAAEARRRMQLDDLQEGDNQDRVGRWSTDRDDRDPNASFDEEMQLAESSTSALARQRSTNKRPIVMDEKVKQEIAIMKRCNHEHVVQLREVIDDRRSKKVFMGESSSAA